MNARFRPLLPLCLSLLVLAGPLSAAVLRVRADAWMPFNGDPAAAKPGYVVELLREIFEPQGIKVDYQTMPWVEAVKAAEGGQVDGILCANSHEAARLVCPNEPVAEPQYALFTRRDNAWKYDNLHSLEGIKLGAAEGYSYWESLDGYLKKAPAGAVRFYQGDGVAGQALAGLDRGDIQVFVESTLVVLWEAKKSGRKFNDYRMAYSERVDPLFVAFTNSDEGRRYARLFDLGIKALKKSGRYDAILDAYGFVR